VLSDSAAVGYVVNARADAAALFLRLDPDLNHYEGRAAVIDGVEAALVPFEARYAFRYSGFPYLRNTYVELLQVETVKYVALSSLVIFFVLLWLFRSVRGVVLPLVTVYLGVVATAAVMTLFAAPIDVLSSTVAAIILVVGVADAMHLLVKYYNGLGEGLSKRAAVRQMVVRLGAATFLTSLTTAIGFGTLATSPVVPMQRFGLFTAVGVMLTFVISIVLVTVVVWWAPVPKARQVDRLGRGRLGGFLDWLDRFTERRAKGILLASLAVTALGLAGASQLRINTYINDDMGPRTRVYQDLVWFEERLTTPWQFEVLLRGETGAFKDPAALRQAEAVARWLEARPEVRRVVAVPDLLKELNRALHGDSLAYYRLPEDPALAAQQLFLLELTDPDLLQRFVDFDYGEARVAALMNDIGSARMKAFRADLDAFLDETLDGRFTASTTGTVMLAAQLSDYLVESLLVSIALAFGFISLLMAGLFRNAKLVLVSLVPNVIPLVAVAGLMGFAGIDVNPATAVIFSISFGIAVDDTIHLLTRLKQELARGLPLRDALRATLLGTGKAVVLTSVVLIGGFGALLTSRFESTTYLGGLVSITVALALLDDLFLLPALVHLLRPKLTPSAAVERSPSETPVPVAP
jgi:predicted RND superfamily exporter protein